MKYLSIDTETTGLDDMQHKVIEIGIIECELGKEALWGLRILVVHDSMNTDLFCANMHRDLWPELLRARDLLGRDKITLIDYEAIDALTIDVYAARPQAVTNLIKEWLGYTKFTIAGKNVAFDIGFLNRLSGFKKTFKIRSRRLDPVMFYLNANDKAPPSAFECIKRSGLNIEYPHRAVEDALVVQKLIEHGSRNQRTAS